MRTLSVASGGLLRCVVFQESGYSVMVLMASGRSNACLLGTRMVKAATAFRPPHPDIGLTGGGRYLLSKPLRQ